MGIDLTKDLDTALLAYSTLKRLGGGEVDTFVQRLKSQKIQYIAQLFGVSPKYKFNLYIRGPYSPALANDLFALKERKVKVDLGFFTPNELEERFLRAKNFIKKQSVRQLELTATFHWLRIVAALPVATATTKLREIKSATAQEASDTLNLLSEL